VTILLNLLPTLLYPLANHSYILQHRSYQFNYPQQQSKIMKSQRFSSQRVYRLLLIVW